MLDVETLTLEYAKSFMDKSRIYFIEKYFSTFNANEGKYTQFTLFPRQKVFLRNIADHSKNISLKHRQCGITTISSAWSAAQCVFASKESPEVILCIANKLEQAQELLFKIRDFLLQVPRWFWGDEFYSDDPKSEKNKKEIFITNSKAKLELFNGCKVFARSSGPNAARGISAVSILIFDEAAFIEEGMDVYTSAVAATASNPNRKIIMVSTPNGKDALYYNTYKQAIAKENGFIVTEFKWYQDLRYNKFLQWYKKNPETGETDWITEPVLDKTGTVKYDEELWKERVRQGYTPTSKWYMAMCQSFNNDSMKIAQELDVSFLGSANNVVDPQFIEMHQTLNVREPLEEMKDPLVEETWFWKPPIDGHRYICAIDPSRGVASDNTAIEIIDMDGRDENGLPIIEQVAEYVGKRLGDEMGAIAYQYATMYNNAFIVADATGGQADALLLTLINMGYKNLYYEDANQKTYTLQNVSKSVVNYNDRLPGFHFQGNRYPVLANFAGMVRNNEFKVRSVRVINELETWIFKGETGRMDHMGGSHDDTITALAMGLFVMQYSLNRIEANKSKDAAILKAYMMGGGSSTHRPGNTSVSMTPKNVSPFYNGNQFKKYNNVQGNFMWLFSNNLNKKKK